jgi:hypothetical protein
MPGGSELLLWFLVSMRVRIWQSNPRIIDKAQVSEFVLSRRRQLSAKLLSDESSWPFFERATS